ncbi:hypothetical protein CEXT_587621 [Caerostris extrusa]|uniref:Uncharacterized protein n=1 Tax=Caerostris extrusa TaxID=172846 RepID=A0AAV4QZN1_CAEEX|nr:hypothetical protein CEXT_587621 [Caerostris extrusa]
MKSFPGDAPGLGKGGSRLLGPFTKITPAPQLTLATDTRKFYGHKIGLFKFGAPAKRYLQETGEDALAQRVWGLLSKV